MFNLFGKSRKAKEKLIQEIEKLKKENNHAYKEALKLYAKK